MMYLGVKLTITAQNKAAMIKELLTCVEKSAALYATWDPWLFKSSVRKSCKIQKNYTNQTGKFTKERKTKLLTMKKIPGTFHQGRIHRGKVGLAHVQASVIMVDSLKKKYISQQN